MQPYRGRARRAERHPVWDFLFTYYSLRFGQLRVWHPGYGVVLQGAGAAQYLDRAGYVDSAVGVTVSAEYLHSRTATVRFISGLLKATRERAPRFNCFGLHEWAMVYRDPNVRHPYVPLRMSRADIDSFVESQSLRCTHYDAFRFFTQEATPRNRIALTRVTSTDHEQPGCIHANMDLYRFAYKIAPFGMSELLADAFELAEAARAVDMRASPYDLSGYGYAAIPIETREGREEYVEEQRRLAERAVPLRERMLEEYVRLLNAIASR